MDGLVRAAEEASSPLIIQISVKTFLYWGGKVIADTFAENYRITKEISAFAKQYGAHVEGEVVAVTGVEDGIGSETDRRHG